MKKTAAIALTVMSVVSVMLLACGCDVFSTFVFSYPDEDKYTVGNGEVASAESIDVDWISGEVNVVAYDGDKIIIDEKINAEVKSDFFVRWYLDGSELKIKYCKSGLNFGSKNGSSDKLNKTLTVSVPESLILKSVTVNSVSGDVTLGGAADEIKVDTVSGNVTLGGTADKAKVNTVSGNVFSGLSAKTLSVKTVSGDIDIKAFDTMSVFDADSVSGNVTVDVEGCSGAAVKYSNVSGKLSTAVDVKTDGDADGKPLVYGDGRVKINVDTVSGDLMIVKGQTTKTEN